MPEAARNLPADSAGPSSGKKSSLSNKALIAVFILFAALLYGVIFGWDCGGPAGMQGLTGRRAAAADFTLPDLSGKTVSLKDFRGKVVFLNIWATWCPPCRQEMPDIQSLYRKMDPSQFAVLALSVDKGGREDVASFFRTHQIEVPTVLDVDNKVAGDYGVTGFPETFLIDKKGQLVERFIGPRDWLSPELMARYRQLIAE